MLRTSIAIAGRDLFLCAIALADVTVRQSDSIKLHSLVREAVEISQTTVGPDTRTVAAN
jgi:hypothetical protein